MAYFLSIVVARHITRIYSVDSGFKSMEQKVNKELRDSTAIQEVKILKEWISKQPHLPQNHDDMWLENFLKGCKFSVERCKLVLDNFYTIRSKLPHYFQSGDPSSLDVKQTSQLYYHIFLTNTPEDDTIVMFGLLETDESKFDAEAIIHREILIYNWFLNTKKNPTFIVILDMCGVTMSLFSKAIPHLKCGAFILQDAMPFRFKQFHIINTNPLLKTLLPMVTPFIKEKLRNRIHIHTDDLTTLYKFVPQELLPIEYGGKADTVKSLNDGCQGMLEDLKDVLIEEYKKKTDESKRTKDCTQNELFGAEGSFKSLNID